MSQSGNHPFSKPFIVLGTFISILIISPIILSINYLESPISQSPRAAVNTTLKTTGARIKEINNIIAQTDLSKTDQRRTGMAAPSADTLRPLLEERKKLLRSYLPENPEGFVENVLSEEVRNQLPAELVNEGLLETKQDITGELTLVIIENENQKTVIYEYYIGRDRLHIPEGVVQPKTHDTIQADGYRLEDNLVVSGPLSATQIQAAATPAVVGPQRILVVNVQTPEIPSFITTQALQTAIFGQSDSVAAYYSETSGGLMSMTGEIAPLITLSNVPDPCQIFNMTGQVETVLTQQGYNLSSYRVLFYIMPIPEDRPCPFNASGYGELGGQRAWQVGNRYIYKDTISHEIGHVFGLHHANTYSCGTKSIDVRSNCINYEYGDPFDEMGGQYDGFPQFNAPHKAELGWIPETGVRTITADQQITILAHERTEPEVKTAKVWSNANGEYYYISYRQALGFDSVLPTSITQGTHIHLMSLDSTKSNFVDANPNSLNAQWLDATLRDNQVFYDEQANITIRQLSHTAARSTIFIDVPDNYPPVIDYHYLFINGLLYPPAGSSEPATALLNQPLTPNIEGYDYSDAVTISWEITKPDGSLATIPIATQQPQTGLQLCQIVKCFISVNTNSYSPDQLGQYTFVFKVTDAQGAVTVAAQAFTVSDSGTPTITTSPTNSPTPTLTPTSQPPSPTPTPTSIVGNMLINPSFEIDANQDKLPEPWIVNERTSSDKITTDQKYDGKQSFQLICSTEKNKTIYQNIPGNWVSGTTFSFLGFSKGVNIKSGSQLADYRFVITYADGSMVETFSKLPTGSHGWKESVGSFTIPAPATRIRVAMRCGKQRGRFYFDAMKLQPATQSSPNPLSLKTVSEASVAADE